MIYAVIDTNVLVAALLSKTLDAATVRVVEAMLSKKIIPLFSEEIIDEYAEVLRRRKFDFSESKIESYINTIRKNGLSAQRLKSNEFFPDPKDIVFYEVAISKEDAYLVTGNTKHFPHKPIVVTPAEMVEILISNGLL